MSRRSRDEDARFAEIVEREFSEQWQPPAAEPEPAPEPPPSPAPQPFELNLYDDEESYRAVPPRRPERLGRLTMVGLVGLAVAVIGFVLLLFNVDLPTWVRWIVVVAMITAAGIGIKRLLRREGDDDDSAVV